VSILGKFIIAYAPLWGEKEYYLGCACEELYAPPSAYFSLYGLTAQAQFLGGKYWYLKFQLKFSVS
jgi:protease IV